MRGWTAMHFAGNSSSGGGGGGDGGGGGGMILVFIMIRLILTRTRQPFTANATPSDLFSGTGPLHPLKITTINPKPFPSEAGQTPTPATRFEATPRFTWLQSQATRRWVAQSGITTVNPY